MAGDIKHYFEASLVDHTGDGKLTDGGVLWEITAPDGERVASCTTEEAANELVMELDLALSDWCDRNESDHIANC